ncbi:MULTISPECIES: serine hydrolase domain-containing protein [unclassified Pseudoalteromonas]|uniref:serine hydrolase domain-containing protein n=1 Tax=unclassified Pseudoalteromonas TaxID=194690 RepID=UPI0016019CE0|nr:serine hydrolase domain-containing protein [Pseudoalteromonas sp. SR44-8]MBB1302476.1 serine hydrolase [Pseudoalteromonas sp. SR44-8]
MKLTSNMFYHTIFMTALLLLSHTAIAGEHAKEMDAFIEQFHGFKQFNGNVLVAKQGKVIFEKSYGYANFEWDIKNTAETKFRIGSITKQFTALLILQLAQQNKIQLDAPLATYLPDYRQDIGNKITIRQILNHTSGLSNYTQTKTFRSEYSRNPYSVDEFIKLLCSDDLLFEPGTQFRYSNSGYFILGAVIEKVTQQRYQDVLQENIFKPLNMHNTGYDSHAKIINQRASGYSNNLDGYTNADYLDMSIPYAAGSIYSTARDLVKWDQALYTNKLINKELKKQMYTVSEQRNYALGWEVNQLDADKYGKPLTQVQHGGGIEGFNAFISRIIEDQLLVIILNNTGGAPMTPMTKGLTNIFYGKPYDGATENVDSQLYHALQNGGIAQLKSKYNQLDEQKVPLRERSINYFGYELIAMKKLDAAIAVFELNAAKYPDSANTHDSLGEAYLTANKPVLALKSYQRALELNPDSESAKQAIIKLQ